MSLTQPLFVLLMTVVVCLAETTTTLASQVQTSFSPEKRETALCSLASFSSLPGGSEAMRYVLFEEAFQKRPRTNHALILLAHLLEATGGVSNDTMLAAIALANSYYAATGNAELRSRIMIDSVSQRSFYRKTVSWQKAQPSGFSLASLPFSARIAWAARERVYYPTPNTAEYLKRVPQVADLESLQALLIQENVVQGTNRFDIVDRIQRWYRAHSLPAGEIPKDRTGYYFPELMTFFRENGRFLAAHCVADASNLWSLFQAAGIPVLTYYQNFRGAGTSEGINHEWPVYYDPERRKWESAQRAAPWPKGPGAEVPVDFEIFRPLWHHWLADDARIFFESAAPEQKAPHAHIGGACRINSYGERTQNGLMRRFVLGGVDEALMEKIFWMPTHIRSAPGTVIH